MGECFPVQLNDLEDYVIDTFCENEGMLNIHIELKMKNDHI
jgi:hypothetical protein